VILMGAEGVNILEAGAGIVGRLEIAVDLFVGRLTRKIPSGPFAIVEGTYNGDFGKTSFKVIECTVPPDTAVILDGRHNFRFYGMVEEGAIQKTPYQERTRIVRIEGLSFSLGIVITPHSCSQIPFGNPRAVLLQDGSLFSRKDLGEDYLTQRLPEAIPAAQKILTDPDLPQNYFLHSRGR